MDGLDSMIMIQYEWSVGDLDHLETANADGTDVIMLGGIRSPTKFLGAL